MKVKVLEIDGSFDECSEALERLGHVNTHIKTKEPDVAPSEPKMAYVRQGNWSIILGAPLTRLLRVDGMFVKSTNKKKMAAWFKSRNVDATPKMIGKAMSVYYSVMTKMYATKKKEMLVAGPKSKTLASAIGNMLGQ